MKIPELPDRLSSNQRGVARKHNDDVISRQRFPRHHERMSSAALLRLPHKVHARACNRFAHTLRLMSDDDENVSRWNDL